MVPGSPAARWRAPIATFLTGQYHYCPEEIGPVRGCRARDIEPLSSCAGGRNGLVSRGGDEAGPLVVGVVIPLIKPATEGALSVPCPATPDVPHELVEHVAWLLYEHRRTRSTRRRTLGCFKQAPLALVHLRKNETFSQLGAGFGYRRPPPVGTWTRSWTFRPPGRPAFMKPSPVSVRATMPSLTAL